MHLCWPIADEGTVPTPLRLSFKSNQPLTLGAAAGGPMAEAGQKGKSAEDFNHMGLDRTIEALELMRIGIRACAR